MCTVALYCQIMDWLGLKDSSRKVLAIYVISYFFSLYLILHACVQTFDVIERKVLTWKLNKALNNY
jgi:hypothetical protein